MGRIRVSLVFDVCAFLLIISMLTLPINIQPSGTTNELWTAWDGLQYHADQRKAYDQPMSMNVNVANIVDEWLMFMHDERNTGHSLDTVIYPPLTQAWEFDAKYYIAAPPIASHDAVYAVRQDGVVYKLNAVNGSRIWGKNVGYYVDSSPALGLNLVFVSLLNGTLDALNKDTGEIAWMFNTGGWTTSAATYADGIVYVGSSRNVYALNAINGVEKWRFATEGWVEAPAVSNGVVYASSADGRLYAINADSGTEKWRFPAIGDLGTIVGAPIAGDGIVYVPSDKLYALNASNGKEFWSLTPVGSGVAVFESWSLAYDTIFRASASQVQAFDAATGVLKWNHTYVADDWFSLGAIVANDVVYAGFGREALEPEYVYMLVALNALDGSLIWQYTAYSYLTPIIANGRLYATSSYGNKTYCFAPIAIHDYSITASPVSLNIQQGSSDTSVITIHSIGGFNQPVQLTVSGAPLGVIWGFSSRVVTPPSDGSITSTLTVSVATTATPGSYTLTVSGTNGTLTHSTDISLEITATPTPQEWMFAIVTDLHIGRGYDDYGTPDHDDQLREGQDYCLTYRLADVVKWINDNHYEKNIKFLVILGDISDTAEKSEFLKAKEILDNLEIPYVPLMGNHDTFSYTGNRENLESKGDSYFQEVFWDSPGENLEKLANLFEGSWEKQPVPYYSWTLDKYFYFQNYAFSYEEINFICLDYARRDNINIASIAEPFSQTNEWLENHLQKWSGKPVIVFSHYPYIGTGSDLSIPGLGGVYLNEIKRFTDYVKKYNNKVLTFGGHVHAVHDTVLNYNVNQVFHMDSIPVIVTKAMMEPPRDFLRIVKVKGENIDDIDYKSLDLIVEPTMMEVDPNIPSPPNLELIDWLVGKVGSPVEFRVYDSQDRVTGLVNGEVRDEIPKSGYYEGSVTLLAATDTYRYELVGTGEGTYKLELIRSKDQQTSNFTATDIPIASGTIHQYIIDWNALSRGEEGVTVQIDSDGDGTFEKTFVTGNELSRDEFMLQVASSEAFPIWIVGAGVAIATIGIGVATLLLKKRKIP